MVNYLDSGELLPIDFISFQSLLSLEDLLKEKAKQAHKAKSLNENPELSLPNDKEPTSQSVIASEFSIFNPEQQSNQKTDQNGTDSMGLSSSA